MSVTILVGTAKGGFILRSNDGRKTWTIDGPIFKGWKVTAATTLPGGDCLLGTSSDVYGAAIHKSADLKDWQQVSEGPAYPKEGSAKLTQIWKLAAHGETCLAGVADAGLFRSDDRGETWSPVVGLNDHRTRDAWCPGAGGLCAHSILIDPKNDRRMWVGISAVGVFRSDDGGDTWHTKNDGVPVILEDKSHKDIGYCVHALVQDPASPDRVWRQDHRGMFRSHDAGESWDRIENGLPSGFGFPLCRDRGSGALFCVPQESDEYRIPIDGKLKVYRSRDDGDSWQALSNGLPRENVFAGVLRSAMDVDHLAPCGVYFGTTSGDLFVSADGGEGWTTIPCRLPRVNCVSVLSVE